jgi:hypothetical protein
MPAESNLANFQPPFQQSIAQIADLQNPDKYRLQ